MANPELPENGTLYNFDSIPKDEITNTQEVTNGKIGKEIPHIYPDKEKIKYEINTEAKHSLAELSKEFFNKIGVILNKDNKEIQTPPSYITSEESEIQNAKDLNDYIQTSAENPE
ncbi:MAG: hypothetical protein WC850_04625 [Candidatus Gracilibacteria bacterium]